MHLTHDLRGRAIGLIPDGSRRWARQNDRSLEEAYAVAAARVAETIDFCINEGASHLVIYTASRKNVEERGVRTFQALAGAFKQFFDDIENYPSFRDVTFGIFGNNDGLLSSVIDTLDYFRRPSLTEKMRCTLVFNYSVEWDIKTACERGWEADSPLYKSQPHIPPLDMVVRSAGEYRLSDFLPIQSGYAEFVFVRTLWPDWSKADMVNVKREFLSRNRTFGR